MPIDIATGDVELARDDFVLPGRVPLKWTRRYRSPLLNSTNSPLGPGWTASWFPTLKRVEQTWQFVSAEGVLNGFPDPRSLLEKGGVIRLLGAFLELIRERNRYVVTQWDVESGEIQRFVFGAEPASDAPPLVSLENVSGDAVELSRDVSGRLITLRQRTENRTVSVNYTPAGLISSLDLLTNGGGRTELVRYEYDLAGRFSAAFDRRDLANRYEYDAQSRLSREILRDGAVYSYRYDGRGRCIHFTGLDHYNEKRLRFIDLANRTMVTNSYGKTTTFDWLPSGQIAGETDPSGNQSRTEFDEYGRTVSKIDPTGATTRYTYDEHGNRDSITDPAASTYRMSFDAHHQAVSLTNPMGKTWRREFDVKNRVVATADPLGARWTIVYDGSGSPAAITDPIGSTRRLRYDDGLLREVSDWIGNVTQFRFDAFGRVVERVGPTRDLTRFRYDPAGNPIEVELPDGGKFKASYDSGGNLDSFTSSEGHVRRFRYGPCRRLLERVDALGRVVRYSWGTEPERLETVINEKGETFSYLRDDQGRVLRERSFDGREQFFDYDAAGRRIAFTNGNGDKVQFKRDAAGRVTEQVLPGSALARFEYNSLGRLTAAMNTDIPIRFEYDDAGRLIHEFQGQEWVQTEYDAVGSVTRTLTSLRHEVRYELDPNGRLLKLSTGDNHTLAFERDRHGFETGRQMPGGIRMEQRFDSMGRMLEQRVGRGPSAPLSASESRIPAGNEVIKRGFRYDSDGMLLSINDGRWGTTEYGYDPAERLLSALRDRSLNEQFEYDSTDNLTRTLENRGELSDQAYTYGSGNRLLEQDNTRYEYDADGRLVRKIEASKSTDPRTWEYTWDVQSQLRKVRRPDGEEWEYKYDAFGRRVEKRGPSSRHRYLWSGDFIIQDCPDRGQPVAWIMEPGSFAPLAKVQDATIYSVINDHLGTPREMLDSSGKLVWAASATAWGRIETTYSPRPEHSCPIRFQGQWLDEESGLHYSRFRYYDPTSARFISLDPIGLAGGENLYQYVRNPITWIDPFGLTDCKDESTDDKRNSKEKEALVDMAKADKRTGITAADMEAYKQLNSQLPDPFPENKVRGPEAHPDRASPSSQEPHGHVGPVDHIPITDVK